MSRSSLTQVRPLLMDQPVRQFVLPDSYALSLPVNRFLQTHYRYPHFIPGGYRPIVVAAAHTGLVYQSHIPGTSIFPSATFRTLPQTLYLP